MGFRPFLTVILVLLTALSSRPAFAADSSSGSNDSVCRRLLRSLASALTSRDTTVFSVGAKPGLHGGNRIRYARKPGREWEPKMFESVPDPQGDPRWVAHGLDPEVARFFGFEIESEAVAVLPDVKELNGAVETFNARLPKDDARRLVIRFYEGGNKNVPGREYLRRFAYDGELPLGTGGRIFLHDVTYHAPAVFYPQSMVKQAQLRVRALFEFEEYVQRYYPKLSRHPIISRHIESLFELEERNMDFGTAGVSQYMRWKHEFEVRGAREFGFDSIKGKIADKYVSRFSWGRAPEAEFLRGLRAVQGVTEADLDLLKEAGSEFSRSFRAAHPGFTRNLTRGGRAPTSASHTIPMLEAQLADLARVLKIK